VVTDALWFTTVALLNISADTEENDEPEGIVKVIAFVPLPTITLAFVPETVHAAPIVVLETVRNIKLLINSDKI